MQTPAYAISEVDTYKPYWESRQLLRLTWEKDNGNDDFLPQKTMQEVSAGGISSPIILFIRINSFRQHKPYT